MPPSTANALIAEDDVHLTEGTFADWMGTWTTWQRPPQRNAFTLQSLTEANAAVVNLTALTTSVASLTAAYTSLAAVQHASIPPNSYATTAMHPSKYPTCDNPTHYARRVLLDSWIRHGRDTPVQHVPTRQKGTKIQQHANTMGGSMVNKGWESK
eukprot:CCRYP_012895-RA/>CCRYP_012895-RA protein AED:0.86 eAED:1.00 QI:0/-1/0/1/-1/1/1/0/154